MISTRDWSRRLIAVAALALSAAAVAAPGEDFIAEAEQALTRGDGPEASAAVRRALAAGAPRNQVAALAGEVELLRGDLTGAQAWLAPGRFARGTGARGYQALGRLHVRQGDLAGAARAFERALREGPPSAELWVEIGRLQYRVGQHRQALAAAVKAIETDPGDPRALEFRGQLLRDSRGPVAALPWFERALERLPDDLELLGEYAATLAEAGRNQDMLAVVRHMVEVDPRDPRPYFLQAVLAARGGHDDLARRLLARTPDAWRNRPAGRLLAGIIELRTGNAVLAGAEFEALVRIQPDNASAALLLGRALLASGEARELVARLGPAADRYDASSYLLTLVGRAHEQLGDRAAAARYLDRAAGAQPAMLAVLPVEPERQGASRGTNAEEPGAGAMVPQLRRLLVQRRHKEALAAAERAERRFPGSADIATLAGDVALLAGDPEAALARYAQAAEIRRDFALVERMVVALRMLGREPDALALLADHVMLNPRSQPAAALMGRIAAQHGATRAGALLMDHARQLGGSADPRLLADLSATHLAAGEIDSAQNRAVRAYGLQRSSGEAARALARLLEARGVDGAQGEALLAKAAPPAVRSR